MPDDRTGHAGTEPSRERLVELLALARMYRGWTNRELAAALDRDVHSVVPSTGNPKLDLVVKLAAALDWPVEMVVADLYDRTAPRERSSREPIDARALNAEAREAFEAGQFDRVLELTDRVEAGEADADSKAYAAHVAAIALHARGRYSESHEALRRGLRLADPESDLGVRLLQSLAYHYLVLGALPEAEAIASNVIARYADLPREDHRRSVLAACLHVRGSCRRVNAGRRGVNWRELASRALEDLERAAGIFDRPQMYRGSPIDRWLAVTARAGVLELQCLLGEIEPESAIDRIIEFFGDGVEEGRSAAELDSRAWWAIIGCSIVMRHESDPERVDRHLAILTNKADEISNHSGNWALRERVWQIEHEWRMRRDGLSASPEELPLDREDLRNLAGTMARFPEFRPTGWRILRRREIDGGDA